jgi:myo-inositol catabolism protein IolS
MGEANHIELAGKQLSRIGFGCGPLGVHGFGEVDLPECRKAVLHALDEGVQFFDTSDAYGMGLSEEQLGLALGKRRAEAFISTKGGIKFGANNTVFYDNSTDYLSSAIDNSLKRLKTERIDLYQIHYWDKKTPIEIVFGHLEAMVRQGKLNAYGISNFDLSDKTKAFFENFPNFASHSAEFSMVRQQNRKQINATLKHCPNVIFLATGVLAQGLLTGKYDSTSKFADNDRRSKPNYLNFDRVFMDRVTDLIGALRQANFAPVALATAWVLRQFPNVVSLVGIKNRKQLNEVLIATNLFEDEAPWDAIDQAIKALQE